MDRTGNIVGPHTGVMLTARAEEARASMDVSSWSEDEVARLMELRAGHTVVVSFREHHANLIRWAQGEGGLDTGHSNDETLNRKGTGSPAIARVSRWPHAINKIDKA